MLPKKNRIKRESFGRAAAGPLAQSGSFSLRIGKSASTNPTFSFVISKKVAASAVDRNALRRKGYAALGPFVPRVRPGVQGVFVAKKGAEKLSYADLEQEIASLLAKARVLVA